MHYWRQDYFESIRAAATVSTWPEYTRYCHETDRGLRHEALAALEAFISSMEQASFQNRRAFVSWLLTFSHDRGGSERLIPHPLKVRVIEPTLSEWTLLEPSCAEPHRWIGDKENLEIALNLDPSDQIARKKLIIEILRYIEYAGHHLPSGYLGDAKADLVTLNRIEELLQGVDDTEFKDHLSSDVEEERAAIKEYIRGENGT